MTYNRPESQKWSSTSTFWSFRKKGRRGGPRSGLEPRREKSVRRHLSRSNRWALGSSKLIIQVMIKFYVHHRGGLELFRERVLCQTSITLAFQSLWRPSRRFGVLRYLNSWLTRNSAGQRTAKRHAKKTGRTLSWAFAQSLCQLFTAKESTNSKKVDIGRPSRRNMDLIYISNHCTNWPYLRFFTGGLVDALKGNSCSIQDSRRALLKDDDGRWFPSFDLLCQLLVRTDTQFCFHLCICSWRSQFIQQRILGMSALHTLPFSSRAPTPSFLFDFLPWEVAIAVTSWWGS